MSLVALGVRHLAPPADERPALTGYQLRIVDGNHLPATEHRVATPG